MTNNQPKPTPTPKKNSQVTQDDLDMGGKLEIVS